VNCLFVKVGEPNAAGWYKWQCARKECGIETTWVNPKKCNISCTCQAGSFLGDRLARFLARLGIKRKGCGCGKRQEAINRWSYSCTNAVVQTWRIVVGIPHDLIATLLLKLATLLTRKKT
jgi:hypothetical protein